ncbi:F-box/kelch-repeat protein At3g27150 [Carica papaya]|uniref:F-box/kelch-repeat protein At3g27150 n=1 Tax=Carica papaya TaxID=3649 RepID=UPI000B8CC17F|nr:F-box/kelch-repeat protein At3g27150 [Carica papaya]
MSRDKEAEGEESQTDFYSPALQKPKICEVNWIPQLNLEVNSGDEGKNRCSSSVVQPQDADYSYVVSQLSDELEILILARFPESEYWKLGLLNKQFFWLLKSGEIFKIRREIRCRESSVFMLASGDSCWWEFDRQFKSCRSLPNLPADECFLLGDKESLCAGTHLIVSGREISGGVVWRYELETDIWQKGPSMINPRCLFASATCGSHAFVAGGIDLETSREILNSAEKYNPETRSWHRLPHMHIRRKLCSGCYMDNKFFVIGGRDQNGRDLTCGEAYDEAKNTWEHIPNMLRDIPVATLQSPPLIAVVNNQLYSLETSSNELRVYLKASNTWKKLGSVPVKADSHGGWGVAFKSLGYELLVMGASSDLEDDVSIYICCPGSGGNNSEELRWRPIDCCKRRLSHFILNCSVMAA